MNAVRKLLLPILLAISCLGYVGCQSEAGQAQTQEQQDALLAEVDIPETNFYAIETPYGRMVVELFDETPIHRDNFKRLVEEGFYDGTTFHRVIEGFVIQGGDPNTRDGTGEFGQGGPGYRLPAEIRPEFLHRRGALAAARQGDDVNPERESSGSQFYIVKGQVHDEASLDEMEQVLRQRLGDDSFVLSDSARTVYSTEGGTPQLDGQYTIFGQLVEGFDVLDAIAGVDTPRSAERPSPGAYIDRPLEDIPMTVTPLEDYEPMESEDRE